MSFKTLVLDIDGVLIQNKELLNQVKNNCVKYVHKKLPKCKDPVEANRTLYLAHGHTARGLHEVYKVSTNDFNKEVYDRKVMRMLHDEIFSKEFQDTAKEIHDLTLRDWNVCLFTNAPIKWARPVALAIGDTVKINCAKNNVLRCPLKPEIEAYTGFPNHHLKIYVDDSYKNLGPVRRLPNWKPVYFGEDQQEWCPSLRSMWEVLFYVNSVDQWIEDNHYLGYQ
jgi:hypothetical protein